MEVLYPRFSCRFYECPITSYDHDELPDGTFDLDDENVDIHWGRLDVDFTKLAGKGRFKTAHPGWVTLDATPDLPPFTNQKVCVKQIYRQRTNGGIARVSGREELGAFIEEFNCVRWASILLDMTYQFVAREIVERGEPPYPIPELRYTRAMVAIAQGDSEKAFIVEELIYSDEGEGEPQFRKYIDNRHPKSLLNISEPTKAHNIAYFLLFSQHFQWQKTHVGAFVSDYQGASGLLTDPQITSNPYVLHMHASNLNRLADIVGH